MKGGWKERRGERGQMGGVSALLSGRPGPKGRPRSKQQLGRGEGEEESREQLGGAPGAGGDEGAMRRGGSGQKGADRMASVAEANARFSGVPEACHSAG